MCYYIYNDKKRQIILTDNDFDKALDEAHKITDRDGTELQVLKLVATTKQTKKVVKEFF